MIIDDLPWADLAVYVFFSVGEGTFSVKVSQKKPKSSWAVYSDENVTIEKICHRKAVGYMLHTVDPESYKVACFPNYMTLISGYAPNSHPEEVYNDGSLIVYKFVSDSRSNYLAVVHNK